MMDRNIRLNLWINPYVSKQASFYKSISPYTGSHTVWVGEVPDFNIPEARKIFFGQLKKDQVDIGVSGYKIDEVDGYDYYLWPDVATFPSGISAEQMRRLMEYWQCVIQRIVSSEKSTNIWIGSCKQRRRRFSSICYLQ
jgi:alpha-D-xyloside xylohydrolase